MPAVRITSHQIDSVINTDHVVFVDHDTRTNHVMIHFSSGQIVRKEMDGSTEECKNLLKAFFAAFELSDKAAQ